MDNDFPSLYTPPATAGGVGARAVGSAASSSLLAGNDADSGSYAVGAHLLKEIHEQSEAAGSNEVSGSSGAGAGEASAGASRQQQQSNANRRLDLDSETAFPSLGAPSAPSSSAAGGAGWGAAARSRASAAAAAPSAAAVQSNLFTESLVLATASINVTAPPPTTGPRGGYSNREPEPTTLGGVLSQLMARYNGVKVESSTSTAKGTTTLLIKAQRQQDLERVKRDLLGRIVKKVNETLQVPASTRAFIIGSKGKNLKAITEETGVNIQIPRDAGQNVAPASEEPAYENEEEAEDPLIPINLYGDMPSVAQAKARILAIVSERTSRTSTKVTTVPLELYHLLSNKYKRGELVSEEDASNVDIRIPPVWKFRAGAGRGASAGTATDGEDSTNSGKDERDTAITLVGDREAVTRAVEAIANAASELARTTQTLSMTLSKRQHRFVLPPVSDSILDATSCSVEVPPASNPSDQITIRGPSANLVEALQQVMQAANAASVDVIDLASIHGINTPTTYPRAIARYLLTKAKLRKIADEEGVQIFIPRSNDPHTTIDIVATSSGKTSPQTAVANARAKVLDVLKELPPSSFDIVEVEPLLHRFLIGKKGSRIQSFEEKNKVQVVFPPQQGASDSAEDRQVHLVYVGSDNTAAAQTLSTVKEEIAKLAKEAADITTETLTIPANLHRNIIGPSGTTLNALIGTNEERTVNVRFGKNTEGGADDQVVIRGPSDEVKRVAQEIERVAEEAKNDEIVNSYVSEFDIEQRFVSHIVGKGGAGVQKLREELGVRIDFDEGGASSANKDGDATVVKGKKAKTASSKSHVKIQGRKENVEEAKRRIQRQTEQLADETTVSVPMPAGLERGALIGKQGAYAQRLENKYSVRINFPRADSSEDGDRDSNSISIRGGRKGVEGAKKELVELMDYEKEHNQSQTITVPGRALARVIGRQGANIRELQTDSGAEIDISKKDNEKPGSDATFTIRGTKAAIAAAKKAIQAIVSEVQDEVTFEIPIERSMHASIVGRGGQNIRDLITRCGGPSDPRALNSMVRFPRAGEDSDMVTIRGPTAIATKIRGELERISSTLKDRVVYGVAIPQSAHARIIGRGGVGVNEVQKKHDVRVIFSNRQEFKSAGDLVNADEVADATESDLIKILGSKSACEAAAAELKEKADSGPQGGAGRQQRQTQAASITKTVEVPAYLHPRVAQGGKFFRMLPNGIRIDHGDVKPPSNTPRPAQSNGAANGAAKAARIDADDEAEDDEFDWEVTPLIEDDADATPIPWNIRGNDEEKVERVEKMINSAVEQCKTLTHRGVLTVPQSLIPRIVGRQGSGLDKLRALGVSAEVEGRQGANQVIFLGTPNDLESAKQMVVDLSRNQRGGRQ